MVLTCEEMRLSEERLFATGMDAEPLMDRAGLGVADVVSQFFPEPGRVRVYVGKGNNGGDALVAARHLRRRGWAVDLEFAGEREEMSPLGVKKLGEYEETEKGGGRGSGASSCLVFLDGLLGIGAKGPLRGRILEFTRAMNAERARGGATTFAIDIPTGLDGDTGDAAEDAVIADVTVTMAQVKAGLVVDAAVNHVGRLAVVPLDEIEPVGGDDGVVVLEPRGLQGLLSRREFDTHKTMAGRVGVVAGSRGFTGAALMCAQGALRSGAGLVTLYAKESIYEVLAADAGAVSPEVMVKPVVDYGVVGEDKLDVVAIGPGLGLERSDEVVALVRRDPRPMVVDADGLNAVAAAGADEVLKKPAGPRLLTPHPGEMARLWPEGRPEDRREIVEAFTERNAVTLLLKGARTAIKESGRAVAMNSTGNPGMASGGMGDVLTGLCAGLMAQGLGAYDAGCLGAWLSGKSAEDAVASGERSVETLVAGDVLEHLGRAFEDLRLGCY